MVSYIGDVIIDESRQKGVVGEVKRRGWKDVQVGVGNWNEDRDSSCSILVCS